MEAASTCETSANLYQITRRCSRLHVTPAPSGFVLFPCSVLVACLCLVAGSPIPEDALPISFAVTTTAPSTSQDSLLQKHENLSSVCVSMLPAHNAQPQNSVAPYTVTLSKTKVAPGGVVAGDRNSSYSLHTNVWPSCCWLSDSWDVIMQQSHLDCNSFYSERKITPSLSYVTERGEGKMERARGSKTAKSLSEHEKCNWKHFAPF
jgi:hypothetical protein